MVILKPQSEYGYAPPPQTPYSIATNVPGWDKLKQDIEVVFMVPNGWYTQEHGVLARAAVQANIIQEPAQAKFVPETEAAIHWSLMSSGLNPDVSNSL